MKTKLLLLALAFTPALAPLTARAEDEVSYEFFYDNLSPYGEWVEVGDYGTCWRPRDVDPDWAPYTDGYWSYTDAGWTWVSYEDFGDITYHYGRWVRTDDVGWCWVPDYEWGPAWVSWRKNDDYVGWAPLPPEARWRPSVGFSVWVDETCDIGPSYYNFCPTVEFGAPVIRSVCVPRARCISLFGGTVNITNITYNSYNRHVFCGGPDYAYINRVGRRQVPTLKLVQNTTIINNNITIINNKKVVKAPRNVVAGNTLQVFAPKIVNKPVAQVIRPNVTQVIARPKIDKGWAGVKDPGEMARMREKVKVDAKGLTPETAPARPVKVSDLKPLPEKADTSAPSPTQIRPRPFAGDRDRDRDKDDDKGKKGRDGVVTPATPGVPPVPGAPGNQPFIARPGRNEPKVPDTDVKPGRGPAVPTVPTNPLVEERPGKLGKPGKFGGDRPDRVPPQTQPTVPTQPSVVTPEDRPDTKIGKNKRPDFNPVQPTPGNPQRKPFRGGDDNDDDKPNRIAPGRPFTPQVMPTEPRPQVVPSQQPQPDAEAAQRRIAEQQQQQAERQRAAALNAQGESQASARREQMQAQQAAEAREAAKQRQAADAAQRQAAMSRQAEAQQRALQAQRQQQMQAQRQEAISAQRKSQQMERPQAQPQPQFQRQPQQRPPQQQPQPQVQRPPQQQPRGGGRPAPQQGQNSDDDKKKGR